MPVAVIAWAAMYESGVHATIAGVVLGLLTRVLPDEDEPRSPAERLEHRLNPISAGVAVPFFALMSAGVVLTGGTQLLPRADRARRRPRAGARASRSASSAGPGC